MSTTLRSPWLTVQEAAKYLRLSPATLAKMRCRGDGPRYSKSGAKCVYHSDDLDAYLRGRRS